MDKPLPLAERLALRRLQGPQEAGADAGQRSIYDEQRSLGNGGTAAQRRVISGEQLGQRSRQTDREALIESDIEDDSPVQATRMRARAGRAHRADQVEDDSSQESGSPKQIKSRRTRKKSDEDSEMAFAPEVSFDDDSY